jgi:lipopolysaccharide transport system permease protein
MQLLFYATPIFYPIDLLPEVVQKIVRINPLTVLIQASRQALIYGKVESFIEATIVAIIGVMMLIFGSIFFRRNVKRIAESF